MLFAVTAMLHASPLPPGSLWLALAAVSPDTVKRLAERLPQEFTDKIRRRLQRARTAFQRWIEAALAWETVRHGLTPAAKAAATPKDEYLAALKKIGQASLAVKDAVRAHDETLRALEETRQRVYDAQKAFREAKKTLPALKQAYDEAMAPRQQELARARSALREARDEARNAQRALGIDLAWLCGGDRERLEATAQRFQVSERYLRALLGEPHRGLTADEIQDIVDRALAGTPVVILAAEYRVPRSRVYAIISNHRMTAEQGSA